MPPRLMKKPASRTSEGAGGFSLPNKAPRFNVALATGLFFNLPISLCQQSEGHKCPLLPPSNGANRRAELGAVFLGEEDVGILAGVEGDSRYTTLTGSALMQR